MDTYREIHCGCGKLLRINVTAGEWWACCNDCKKTYYLDELDEKDWNDSYIKTSNLA
jgi:hypothetical protein